MNEKISEKSENKPSHRLALGYTVAFGVRLEGCCRSIGGYEAAGRLVQVTGEQVRKWRSGESKSPLYAILIIAKAANVSLEWLATGKGPMRPNEARDTVSPPVEERKVPLMGLAPCGYKDWYKFEEGRIKARCPLDLSDPEAFAIITTGKSLEPFGIDAGFLCFCSPNTRMEVGDFCLIERDGLITLKKLLILQDIALYFSGFGPDVKDYPFPGFERDDMLKMDPQMIDRISVVTHIVTRPVFG